MGLPRTKLVTSGPLRIALACAVALVAIVALIQLSPPCHDWRAWKDFKEAQGRFQTLELFTKPAYCFDL